MSIDGRDLAARPLGQFITEADAWQTDGASVCMYYRLKFAIPTRRGGEATTAILHVRRKLIPLAGRVRSGIYPGRRSRRSEGAFASAVCRVESRESRDESQRTSGSQLSTPTLTGRTLRLGDRFASRIVLMEPAEAKFAEDGKICCFPPTRRASSALCSAMSPKFPSIVFPKCRSRRPPPARVSRWSRARVSPACASLCRRTSCRPDWAGDPMDDWSFPR